MTHKIDNFYDAWHFLREHPAFFYKGTMKDHNEPGFEEDLCIMVVKINPETDEIDKDKTKNTKVEIWLECGGWIDEAMPDETNNPYSSTGFPCHDIDLDTGGPTFEEAVVSLAKNVMDKYGDYVDYIICSSCLKRRPGDIYKGPEREEDEQWYCSEECERRGAKKMLLKPLENGEGYRLDSWVYTNELPEGVNEDDLA